MNSGMLWYNGNSKMTLIEKVAEGAAYYKKKYGRMPDVCVVNPQDVGDLPIKPPCQINVNGHEMIVKSWKAIVTKSIWLGFEDATEPQPKAEKPADSDAVNAFVQHAQKVKA